MNKQVPFETDLLWVTGFMIQNALLAETTNFFVEMVSVTYTLIIFYDTIKASVEDRFYCLFLYYDTIPQSGFIFWPLLFNHQLLDCQSLRLQTGQI